ncbi:hypothetical protein GALMADRAFT_238009 [Galerina marginata CBS 339.88]|uniref:Uncharacterized protein n=1 Tax=Galerina marginata (strain CBS 339.88) TaxID=685588 RepID=A0A067THI9_GALM3|nr:hypothetical protein GALMADRAFT_238009 [Galerina marginata CBS 339.88]
MPRDRQHSSRSRSRSPRRHLDTDVDSRRLDTKSSEATKPSRRSRSRSQSRERRSRSPARKRQRRHDSRSSSSSRSRSRSRDRRRKHRSKSRSHSRDRKEKRRRDRSVSSSSESGDGASHRRKDKRKEKDGKRHKSKEHRREKKREKKERKEKRKKDKGNVPHWGKYGIISDIDIFTKDQEFRTWLVEERKVNPETISKDQQKKEFSRFVEDYNTATLPHEKYYNMEAYDRRMSALRQGEYLPPVNDSYDFQADMKAVSGAHKKKSTEHETYMTKEQLMELRKVQQERSEVGRMKLLGMDVKQNFGVRMDGSMFDG